MNQVESVVVVSACRGIRKVDDGRQEQVAFPSHSHWFFLHCSTNASLCTFISTSHT